jgi:tetratricopeptide (TPR) repeat protein
LQNIFVVQTTPSWWVKIGDFGIAKRVRDGDATELRTATGTQGYEAPEIRGYVEVDEQNPSSIYTNVVDIWSFGCVIYKIVAKQVPFKTGRDIKLFCDERKSFPAEPLQGKLTIDGIDFLKSVLIPKAPARPTADVALRHPWLMSDVDDIESHQGLNIELSNEEHSSPLEANTAAQPHQSEKQGKSRFSTTLDGKDFQAKIKVAVEMEGRHGKSSSSMGDLHPSSHSPSQFASSVPTPESEALLAPIGSGKSSPSGRGSSQSERLLNSTGPDDPEVGAKYFNEKGLLAFNDKNWNAAILHTTRALQLDPGRPIYLCNRAAAYVEAKLYMKALEDLEAAIKGDRFLTSAWYWLGIMRCEQGYSEKSMEAFWECIMCRPYDYNEDTEPFVKHARFELQKITDERDAKATKTLLAPVSLRTKSGPATERTVASPSLIKVRVNVRGNSVALVVAFIITYDALVSLIDTRINQFTHKSVRRGELRLKHLTYNGVLLDISSDEDIRKAFNIWSEKNRFHPGRLGEIYLLCLTEAESESFLAVPPPDRMTLSPSGRERESAEPANRDLKSHRLPASTTQVPPGRAVYRERPTLPAIVSAIPTVYGTKQKPKERSFFGKLKDKLG